MAIPLKSYFIAFFLWCVLFTCIFGVLAALLPNSVAGVLTAMPYLVAMILVLFRFLKRQQRAPTLQEKKRLTLGYTLIFWGFNLLGLYIGLWLFSRQDHNITANFWLYLQQPQFIATALVLWLLLAIPLYVITYWFYGTQAQRMAVKMFAGR